MTLSETIWSAIMLIVIMLSVIMVIVVAPIQAFAAGGSG